MDECQKCGGGMDGDHPDICFACDFERLTGLGYEASVRTAQKQGLTLAQYAKKHSRFLPRHPYGSHT